MNNGLKVREDSREPKSHQQMPNSGNLVDSEGMSSKNLRNPAFCRVYSPLFPKKQEKNTLKKFIYMN